MTRADIALEEIKSVLQRYDLAGFVIVVGPDEAAYLREVSPTWSCAKVEKLPEGGWGIRVRAKLAEYPSREAQKASVEATTAMFMALMNWAKETLEQSTALVAMLARHFPEIKHWERPR